MLFLPSNRIKSSTQMVDLKTTDNHIFLVLWRSQNIMHFLPVAAKKPNGKSRRGTEEEED